MTVLEQELDRLLANPLQHLAAPDGPVIGYVGADVPQDLLLATGQRITHLPWVVDRATPRADQWLESSFPGWARSMLEDWASGAFDSLRQVVFSRGEDSVQRLYYYVCELQRRGAMGGPEPLIFDIARIPRDTSRRHTESAVRRLARQLHIEADGIEVGIRRANARRAAFARLDAVRTAAGSVYEKIARASLFADIDHLLDPALLAGTPPTKRVLLAGSAPPDGRLHRAVEEAGWSVSGELHERSLARLGPAVEEGTGDPAAAIARQRHAMPLGPRGFGDAAEALLVEARRVQADAVVLWLTREDESLAWHVPAQRKRLVEAGIAALVLTARQGDANDGALAEITRYLGELSC